MQASTRMCPNHQLSCPLRDFTLPTPQVESFLSRYTASGRYRPALLAAIVGHPYCRGQLLEVLRKEPPSEHEYLQRITVERLYAEAVAEAETAAAKAAAADAEAGAEAGAEAAAAEAAVVVEVAAE